MKSTASSTSSLPPPYDPPPAYLPQDERAHSDQFNNNVITFLPRTVILDRGSTGRFGLLIRGGPGSEYGCYISRVTPGSEADRFGLKAGDQILSINNVKVTDAEHSLVVHLLQNEVIELKVKYFPHGYFLHQGRVGMI